MHISNLRRHAMKKTVVPLDDVNRALIALNDKPVTEAQARANAHHIQDALDRYASLVPTCDRCGNLIRSAPGYPGPYCKHVGVA